MVRLLWDEYRDLALSTWNGCKFDVGLRDRMFSAVLRQKPNTYMINEFNPFRLEVIYQREA